MSPIAMVFIGILALALIFEEYRQVRKLNKINYLINTYEHDLENPKLIDEIYAYCQQDWRLRRIVEKNQAQREDFQQLYEKLLLWGNFKKGRRFVPISSFFFTTSLDYLLKNRDGDPKKLTMKMMNFFHI